MNWSMTKFGTPIGAAPKSAMVTVGFVLVGEPSGLRSSGGSIGSFGSLPSSSGLGSSACPRPCRRRRFPGRTGPGPGQSRRRPAAVIAAAAVAVIATVDGRNVGIDGGSVGRGRRAGSVSSPSPGPEQPGSSRSSLPSPSSSFRLEQTGSSIEREARAVAQVDVHAALAVAKVDAARGRVCGKHADPEKG